MAKAARAIIIEDDKMLVMHRDKSGSQYYTLVGGRAKEGESLEQTAIREVKEETGLDVISTRPVFYELHPAPHDEQYIFLCEIASPHEPIAVMADSEEGVMNMIGINNHTPMWVETRSLANLQFRSPQLQAAIVRSLKLGFPDRPEKI